MEKAKNWIKSHRKPLLIGAVCLAAVLVLVVVLRSCGSQNEDPFPTLTIETPEKISAGSTQELLLDVGISSFGEDIYPAASFIIHFDPARTEFLGVEEGNVFIGNTETSSGTTIKLPDWSCNIEQSNKSGQINIMYLDLTGGEKAFTRDLLEEEENVVFRLRFRLTGGARPGDVCDLIVEDAVFAASDSTRSLSTLQGTLKAVNGKIVVGD